MFCVNGHSSNISVVRHFPGDSVGSARWILPIVFWVLSVTHFCGRWLRTSEEMCLNSHRSGKPLRGSIENRENQMSLILALDTRANSPISFPLNPDPGDKGHMHVTLHFCDLMVI